MELPGSCCLACTTLYVENHRRLSHYLDVHSLAREGLLDPVLRALRKHVNNGGSLLTIFKGICVTSRLGDYMSRRGGVRAKVHVASERRS